MHRVSALVLLASCQSPGSVVDGGTSSSDAFSENDAPGMDARPLDAGPDDASADADPCAPVVLAAVHRLARRIAVDSTNVFWGNDDCWGPPRTCSEILTVSK